MTELPSQRTRRQELDRQRRVGVTPLPAKHADVKVVGVSFVAGYPQNFHDIDRILREEWDHHEPMAAVLRRNPENRFDANAIEVHVPALGASGMVGHLPAPLAARLAPELDSGVEWAAHVNCVLITPGAEHQPGLSVHLERIGQRTDAEGEA